MKLIIRVVIALVVSVLVFEAIARIFITTPLNQQYDAAIGWRYIGGSSILHSKEGFARNQLNSMGFNDAEYQPKVLRRVVFLGDSMLEALNVSRDKNFVSQLQGKFGGVELINAGRSDMGLPDQLRMLELVEPLKPDAYVLVVSAGDVWDLVDADVSMSDGLVTSLKPQLKQKDQLKELFRPVLSNSALLTHIMRRLKPVILDVAGRFNTTPEPVAETGDSGQVYGMDIDEFYLQSLQCLFAEFAARKPTYVVYLPSLDFADDGSAALNPGSAFNMALVRQAAASRGLHFIDVSDSLLASYQHSGKPPYGFHNASILEGHLNASGHTAVASGIASAAGELLR